MQLMDSLEDDGKAAAAFSNTGSNSSGSPASVSPPRIILFSGPPGCGKLSTLTTYYQTLPSPPRLSIFHTCEHTASAYADVLSSFMLMCSSSQEDRGLSRSVTIVKFYGETAQHPVMALTSSFVQAYQSLWESARPPTTSMRSHTLCFLHTSHDTHSIKHDRYSAFPPGVLNSPALTLFNCTSVTALSIQRRLQQVVLREEERRQDDGGEVERLTAGAGRWGRRLRSSSSTPSHLVSTHRLQQLAESSAGDMRHALNQLQWELLIPHAHSTTTSPSSSVSCSVVGRVAAEVMWDRMIHRDGSLFAALRQPTPSVTPSRPHEVFDVDSEVNIDEERSAITAASRHYHPTVPVVAPAITAAATSSQSPASTLVSPSPLRETSASGSRKRSRSIFDMMRDVHRDDMVSSRPVAAGRRSGGGGHHAPPPPSAPPSAPPSKSSRRRAAAVAAPHEDAGVGRDVSIDLFHSTARLLTQKYTLEEVMRGLTVSPQKLLGYVGHNMHVYFLPSQMVAYAQCCEAWSLADRMVAAAYQGGVAYAQSSSTGGEQLREEDQRADGLSLVALHFLVNSYRVHHTDVNVPKTFVAQMPPHHLVSAYPRIRPVTRPPLYLSFPVELQHQIRSVTGLQQTVSRQEDRSAGNGNEALYAFVWQEKEWVMSFLRRLQSAATRDATPGGEGSTTRMGLADAIREVLPSMVNRCSATEAVLMDYFPYTQQIVLRPPCKTPAPITTTTAPSYLTPSVCPLLLSNQSAAVRNSRATRTTFTMRAAPPLTAPAKVDATQPHRITEAQLAAIRLGVKATVPLRESHFCVREEEEVQSGEVNRNPDNVEIEDFSDDEKH